MSENALYPALLQAMKDFGPVKKDANNPAFRTKYATLQSVLETIEEPLWANGIILVQRFTSDQGGPILVTELIHAASGQSISSALPIVSKDPSDPQKLGGAITYARRYSLLALLGLAPEDDDGNSAAQPRPQTAPRQSPAPRPNDAPRPVQAAQQAPTPFTAAQFAEVINTARAMRQSGDDYPVIVAYFTANRARMTPDQFEDSKEELRMIRADMPKEATR
jgi:hypothetical protein